MRGTVGRLKQLGKWLVLWPLWERMPWPHQAKVAAAAATGTTLLLVVIVAAALSGGSSGTSLQQPQAAQQVASPTPTPTPTSGAATAPTPTPIPAPTPALAGVAGARCIPPRQPEEATLVRVIDGDTIDVGLGGRTVRVRYIGMNTPERDQPYYVEATQANARLVSGGRLYLYKDVSETDRYGRLLRYVVAGDRFVNLELVKEGYAQAATYPPDVACSETFLAAEREARAAQAGLWAPVRAPQPPSSQPQPPPSSPANNCHPSYPDVCIPPPPPGLDCSDIPYRRFRVLQPDPHHFGRDRDGIGCEQ